MKVAVPKEVLPGETRVALVPANLDRLLKAGLTVVVESGAGAPSVVADTDYEKKGAAVERDPTALYAAADIVLKVQPPTTHPAGGHELDLMKPGVTLVAHLGALGGLRDRDLVDRLLACKTTAFSLDCVPRITRAQSMDVLSSMSTLAGYKAVLLAAGALPKMMPMLMTAAGTISAAKVLILGAGVAGLQAIATARRLGAVVEAFDTRAAVKEQVQSLGARFVDLNLRHGDAEAAGGYAKALTEDQTRLQQQLLAEHIRQADIVITTALVPGKPAPVLITAEAVHAMRPGSVIVDLAAERGGNCALTQPGKQIVAHGVTIIGPLNLPATIPIHASQMFSRNVTTLLLDLWKNGAVSTDVSDEVVAGALITRGGELIHAPTKKALQEGDPRG